MHLIIQFVQHNLLKRLSFPHWVLLAGLYGLLGLIAGLHVQAGLLGGLLDQAGCWFFSMFRWGH